MPSIDLAGRTVSYGDDGNGPAVVLIHGLLMDSSLWDPIAEPLRDAYRVLTPEAPGHGESDPVAVGYDFEQYATDLWAALDAIGVSDPVLGGQSSAAGPPFG